MRYYADNSMISLSNTTLGMFILLCFLLLTIIMFCSGCDQDVSPPDISNCSRIEVKYYPSTLDYFFRVSVPQNIFNQAEMKYIQSLKTFVVNDQKRIKSFAHDISLGCYDGLQTGKLVYACPVQITYYHNKQRVNSFTVFGNEIIDEYHHRFKYPPGLPNLTIIEPMEIRPFKLRGDCAYHLETLHTAGPLYRRDINSYPDPDKWCDAMVQFWRSKYYIENNIKRQQFDDVWISKVITCPSVLGSVYSKNRHDETDNPNSTEQPKPMFECYYAMNPNCKPDSPSDMVLLFETKAGWNQHGGPELFTFDNHNPKGGCVLLNDGTVKFIRTTEELQELRWK